jgi:hypothetical protein
LSTQNSIPLSDPSQHFVAKQRWRPVEIAFWPVTLLPFVLTPTNLTQRDAASDADVVLRPP